MKEKNRRGIVLITAGLILILAAVGFAGYNLWDQNRAAESVERAMTQLEEVIPTPGTTQLPEGMVPDYILAPEMEMPTVKLPEGDYIGYITIPSLELQLPVMDSWSYENLKQAPCRYSGSAYTDDLVICAHNYEHHFGKLSNLGIGDEVYFTDADGNQFAYAVAELEQLEPNEAKRMLSGDWDLSLFTCTVSGRYRVTVRCETTEAPR